jgi:putative transposase
MPKKKRITKAGIAYHAFNRANGKLRIFKKDLDFIAFENVLAEGVERFDIRLSGYCIMSNHWHMLLWPANDKALPDFMHWVTLTHAKRWHAAHGTTGIGHLYQNRYKSFPIQNNWRYLKAMQYIESNPLRAGIVKTAADWQWSSFVHRIEHEFQSAKPFTLNPGPVPLPKNWAEIVNKSIPKEQCDELVNCINRGCPYGEDDWTVKTAEELNLESTLKKRGRPKKWK